MWHGSKTRAIRARRAYWRRSLRTSRSDFLKLDLVIQFSRATLLLSWLEVLSPCNEVCDVPTRIVGGCCGSRCRAVRLAVSGASQSRGPGQRGRTEGAGQGRRRAHPRAGEDARRLVQDRSGQNHEGVRRPAGRGARGGGGDGDLRGDEEKGLAQRPARRRVRQAEEQGQRRQ